jgi:hypothetical protein
MGAGMLTGVAEGLEQAKTAKIIAEAQSLASILYGQVCCELLMASSAKRSSPSLMGVEAPSSLLYCDGIDCWSPFA